MYFLERDGTGRGGDERWKEGRGRVGEVRGKERSGEQWGRGEEVGSGWRAEGRGG